MEWEWYIHDKVSNTFCRSRLPLIIAGFCEEIREKVIHWEGWLMAFFLLRGLEKTFISEFWTIVLKK